MHKNSAFYISNKDNKRTLIKHIMQEHLIGNYSNLKGALFSEITIEKFIEEEIRHGHYEVATPAKNSLEKSSQGERKKALLNHLISQNLEYLVVDNVFGSLDGAAQEEIEEVLAHLSCKIPIIQIANRRRDILPFIDDVYLLQDGKPVLQNGIEASDSASQHKVFVETLPKAYRDDWESISPLVKFNNVTVAYNNRPVVKNICWEIKPGTFWQLVGPNGSGKSTLLTLISGDNPKAFNQDITLFGVKKGSGESVWDIKKKIGYFSSEMLRGITRLDSIGNMIASGFFDTIGLYKVPTNEQIKIVQQWLRVLGMYEIRKQSFLSLSRGYQRLVLIARAMVKHPPLLILDEPTNGLDDCDVDILTELINKIAHETDTAILYVSHRKEEKLLKPDFIYELVPRSTGSIGRIISSS
ncbi:ATP-binding cassette domain-containing protein [Snuella sedimenti]|uniref:ATP-binding cassette domain-containing protein n=1 Tax=Snuella sedimenti TaxID=2798802 RepID=A0A8J7J253_9FLAO|nr:ATP-binding cassette domain-containing protein [Snuella sedimenti]MBJ6367679.1 ATP-binding cassette domain-containing protein [Snuella sedimenti]